MALLLNRPPASAKQPETRPPYPLDASGESGCSYAPCGWKNECARESGEIGP